MMDLTAWWLHLSPWSSWCLDVLECESGDSISWQGPCWEGELWEGPCSVIAEQLWKPEPELMAAEVCGGRR